ncbi:NLP3-like protein [Tanacetum coccineum]
MYIVSRSTLKRICRGFGISRWPYKNDKSGSILKSNQTDVVIHASERATTLDLGTSIEPLGPSNIYVPVSLTEHGNQSSILVSHKEEQTNLPDGSAQPKTTIGEQYIKTKSTHKENTENTSAANAVKTLTIKATYKENTVKFPFSISDGLVKLEELVATRFNLSPGSFRLKYADADGDMILIACDSDLMGSVGDSRQPDHQTLIRLLVLPVVHQNPDTN